MRRGTIVAGVTAGVLGAGALGAAAAGAAPVPITVDVTGGTVKAGSLASAPSTGVGQFAGTIDSTTFAATFPAAGNALPTATVPSATVGVYTGPITIARKPGAFTGQGVANASGVSLNLSGSIDYTFTGGTNVCTGTSVLPASNLTPTFTGAPIDLATGAYSASGSSPSPTVLMPGNATSTPFCVLLATQISPVSTVASAITGKVTIPGVIPLPAVPATPAAPTTPAPSTPAAPATPSAPAATRTATLAVSVSKPKTVRRGRAATTKIVVRNTGAGTARAVVLKVAAGKGVTPSTRTKTYATIGAGKSRTISLRLRTTRSAARSSTVKASVTGSGGLSAAKSVALKLR